MEIQRHSSQLRRPGRRVALPSRDQVRALLDQVEGPLKLALMLIYGSGLGALECLHLRLKDVDLAGRELILRRRRREREQRVPMGGLAWGPMNRRVDQLRREFASKRHEERGVDPGEALLFPARAIVGRLYPIHPSALQRALDTAAELSGLRRRITCETLRRACAAHLLEDGHDAEEIRRRLAWN